MHRYAATLLAAAFTLSLVGWAGAQTVAPHAVGLRLNDPFAFSFGSGQPFQYFSRPALSYRLGLTERSALEGVVGFTRERFGGENQSNTYRTITGELSYQSFFPIAVGGGAGDGPALRAYLGAGAGIASSVARNRFMVQGSFIDEPNRSTNFYAFGLVGIAYRLPKAPVELTFDVRPTLSVSPNSSVSRDLPRFAGGVPVSLGARFTFGRAAKAEE